MSWKRKAYGGLLGFIGFLLSPLSWWNDLFVNVPLAVALYDRPSQSIGVRRIPRSMSLKWLSLTRRREMS